MKSNSSSSDRGWPRAGAVVARGLAGAVALASRRPDVRVHVFAPDWKSVDRARAELEARGLVGRVHVWHRAAAGVVRRVIRAGRAAA